MLLRTCLFLLLVPVLTITAHAATIQGRVVSIDSEARRYVLEILKSAETKLKVGDVVSMQVGPGDAGLEYTGREIRAEAAYYSKRWNLETVFPLTGDGAQGMRDVNAQLRKTTATMSRRKFVRQGDFLPDFGMINQNGDFVQIRSMRGKPFVMNFIFTRCQAPTMCPASTTRMSEMQDLAREQGMEGLHYVTISFDPEFDSPGVLTQYAKGYAIETDNFHLLTNSDSQVVEDLLRQFGIMTIEEDGTINHTMATLLVDKNGRVAFRKEGSRWTVKEFLTEASKLN
ncbi:SCO family protein [Coraliomargarita akajimensis]|uniref:Electron transport protein SCO1/SenC n=1 Tax=Coraliomargarita akajimensis (strain DSM 45221 / IAM 15411 / JCM 23193 / KCTC 12865 / 04OKA010-24) TaxID=583355 RepID=D5EIK2_CORAD|nr:SCO family protein [Coraliomargarita akajimensis]ADE54268.1 electron transport protein SCO1/SenC [Coraliomargarita akajimensis DSM 45221]